MTPEEWELSEAVNAALIGKGAHVLSDGGVWKYIGNPSVEVVNTDHSGVQNLGVLEVAWADRLFSQWAESTFVDVMHPGATYMGHDLRFTGLPWGKDMLLRGVFVTQVLHHALDSSDGVVIPDGIDIGPQCRRTSVTLQFSSYQEIKE